MRSLFGWSGKILRVDLSHEKSTVEDVMPFTKLFLGGRGINAKIVYDEVKPEMSPYDPGNIMCLGPGVLTGTPTPGASRTTITSMSPRGLLDSAGIGGFVGPEIRYAGYDNIIVQGKAERPTYVFIHDDLVEFRDAAQLWGKDPWTSQQIIEHELGDKNVRALSIGCAGEHLVHFACITTGKLSSSAGRCGLGAIMGGKNLKAIAVRGTNGIKIAEKKEFSKSCLEMHQLSRQNPHFDRKRRCGSDKDIYVRYIDKSGKFVSGNWEDSDWHKDGFYRLLDDPEEFWNKYASHQKTEGSHQPGCFGCPVYHESYFDIPENEELAQTKCVGWLSLSGPVWLTDRKSVIQANHLCNKYGLDVVSTGNCISFLMELYQRGIISEQDTDGLVMKRGDINAITCAIKKIAYQEGFGKLFKNGIADAAREIGRGAQEYAMQVKSLEMYPEEVRAYKSMALLSAVGKVEQYSVLDAGWVGDENKMEILAERLYGRKDGAIPTTYTDKALSVWDSENRHCVADLLGICKFHIPWGYTLSLELPARIFSSATGVHTDEDDLLRAAQRVLLLERTFNVFRGIRRKDDILPENLYQRPVTDGIFKGEVLEKDEFHKMVNEYYQLRGYDFEGIPMEETFIRLDLSFELEQLKEYALMNIIRRDHS
jgi:aldehyde:ferredoxin oxidoreductase